MSDAVFRRESAVEYFKEMVEGALVHQGLATQELTAFYVVQLLTSFLQRPAPGEHVDEAPLALRLAQAFESGGARQRESLRQIGDVALFVSGFFSDSLTRKLVDVDYYVSIGGWAYSALSRIESDTFSPVFAELGEKFVGFVTDMDVLGESIRKSDQHYANAMKKLSEGRGNLVRQVEMLKKLGLRTTKSIPKAILDRADVDQAELALSAEAESEIDSLFKD